MNKTQKKITAVLIIIIIILATSLYIMPHSEKEYYESAKSNIQEVQSDGLKALKENIKRVVETQENTEIVDGYIKIEDKNNVLKTSYCFLDKNNHSHEYEIILPYDQILISSVSRGEEINDPTGIALKDYFNESSYEIEDGIIKVKKKTRF